MSRREDAKVGYIYNAEGTCVARGTLTTLSCSPSSSGFAATVSWVLGPGGSQMSEYTVSGSSGSYTSTWAHSNVYAGAGPLATYSTSSSYTGGDTYFDLTDWQGSKRAEFSAGGCGSTFVSLPFGNTLYDAWSYTIGSLSSYTACADATEHHFTGKERDAETGNDYFGA